MPQAVYTLDTLFRIAHDLHKSGKKIGLTHGAFDIFHTAHLDFLQKSAQQCDYLFVGVDSDHNVTNYKGNIVQLFHRPSAQKSLLIYVLLMQYLLMITIPSRQAIIFDIFIRN